MFIVIASLLNALAPHTDDVAVLRRFLARLFAPLSAAVRCYWSVMIFAPSDRPFLTLVFAPLFCRRAGAAAPEASALPTADVLAATVPPAPVAVDPAAVLTYCETSAPFLPRQFALPIVSAPVSPALFTVDVLAPSYPALALNAHESAAHATWETGEDVCQDVVDVTPAAAATARKPRARKPTANTQPKKQTSKGRGKAETVSKASNPPDAPAPTKRTRKAK